MIMLLFFCNLCPLGEDHLISPPNIYLYIYYYPWPLEIGHAHDLNKKCIATTFTTKSRKPSPWPSQWKPWKSHKL
jgi:hypothetical protein